jgi:hypothetical protein
MPANTAIYGRFVGCRLFAEGIELDVVQATVKGGINSPATAEIMVPYNDFTHKIEPRTLVHLYYMDSRYELGREVDKEATDNSKEVNPTPQTRIAETDMQKARKLGKAALTLDKNNPYNWKLLFVGEIVAYSYRKIGAIRQCKFVCQDVTSYWQDAKLYWGRRNTSLHSYKQAIFTGATQLYRGKSRVDSSSDLVKLLSAKPSVGGLDKATVSGLLGGLFATLESVTGVYSPDAKRKFRGVNDFMSQAEMRLSMTRMMGASSYDDTTATFIQSRSFKRYLRKLTRQLKSTASYFDVMNMILKKCYQVWSSVPAPPYITQGKVQVKWLKKMSGFNYKADPAVKTLHDNMDTAYRQISKHLANAEDRRRNSAGVKQVANSIDPVKMRAKPGQSGAVERDTGEHLKTANVVSGAMGGYNEETLRATGAAHQRKHATRGGRSGTTRAAAQVNRAYGHAANAMDTVNKITQHSGGQYDGATIENYRGARLELERGLKKIRKAAGASYKTEEGFVTINPRLHCFLFHPDIFMCPPPKCNVLFPDSIQAITFTRGWMSEVSRIWLHGRTESGRARKNCYFSPNTSILSSTDKLAETAVKKGHNFLMHHERFTGIKSSIVGLGDNDIFKKIHVKGLAQIKSDHRKELKAARRGGNPVDKKVAAKKLADDINDFSGGAQHSPQPHLQRAANYMFFASRYGSRQMTVECRFSPHLVASLPCLVLDPMNGTRSRFIAGEDTGKMVKQGDGRGWEYKNADAVLEGGNSQIKQNLTETPKGTHFIGIIAEITHVLNAEGGAKTRITMVKCREHNEVADIWRNINDDGVMSAKRVKKRYWKRQIKPKGSNTSAYGNSNGNFTAVASPTATDSYELGQKRDIMGTQFRKGGSYSVEAVQEKGVPKRIKIKGLQFDMGGNPMSVEDGEHDAVEVKVYQHGSSTKVLPVQFSFEAIAMPPWFAKIYHPGVIGESYYTPMVGCDSIVDGAPFSLSSGKVPDPRRIDVVTTSLIPSTGEEKTVTEPIEVIELPMQMQSGAEARQILVPKDLFDPPATSQTAADQLAELWLGLKEIGADANLFMDTYVQRSHANLLDIMGNQNPYLRLIIDPNQGGTTAFLGTDAVEGFHGWAYGKYAKLENLTGELDRLAAMNPRTEKREVDKSVDTRAQKWWAVQQYASECGRAKSGLATPGSASLNMS